MARVATAAVSVVMLSCGKSPSSASIGPQGGLVASEDEGLTIVLWPGALGQFEDFEITPSEMAPESFGQAYRVRPNVTLAVDAEIILRGDLPDDLSTVRVGALDADDVASGTAEWNALPHTPGAVDSKEGTVHSHDDRVALYYAMLDDGVDSDATTTGDDTGGTESTGTDPTGPATTTSYARDIATIWNPACTTAECHGAAATGGLMLMGDAYDALVNAPATANPAYTRVIPGDPEGSLLVQKLSNMQPADGGTQMPPTGGFPAGPLDVIRTWINEDCPP